MPKRNSEEREMEIANFVCLFGDQGTLLDYLREIVEPAFFGERERKYGESRYLFLEVTWVNVGTANVPSPAIAGRFVKDTKLVQEQQLVDGELEPADDELDSAPSAVFVLILEGHRLLYVREHIGSP